MTGSDLQNPDNSLTKKTGRPSPWIHNTKLVKQARKEFMAGKPMSRIAKDLEVSRQTLSEWAKKGQWHEEKAATINLARQMSIEENAGKMASDMTMIDNRHRKMANQYTEMVEKAIDNYHAILMDSPECEDTTITMLARLGSLAETALLLERKVTGLEKTQNLPKPEFPTGLRIQVATPTGIVQFEPGQISDQFIAQVEEELPNQNHEYFGEVPEGGNPEEDEYSEVIALMDDTPISLR